MPPILTPSPNKASISMQTNHPHFSLATLARLNPDWIVWFRYSMYSNQWKPTISPIWDPLCEYKVLPPNVLP